VVLAPPPGNSQCWDGDFNYDVCCLSKDPACWDTQFTFQKCCTIPALTLGDAHGDVRGNAECWHDAFTFETCCVQYNQQCFDAHHSFEHCCGAYYTLSFVAARLWSAFVSAATWPYWSWVLFMSVPALPAVYCSIVGLLGGHSDSARSEAEIEQQRPPQIVEGWSSRAAAVRVFATVGVMVFHMVGYPWYVMSTLGVLGVYGQGPLHSLLMSLSVVSVNVFFILSTFLAASLLAAGSEDVGGAKWMEFLRRNLTQTALALLRRVVRSTPTFLVTAPVVFRSLGGLTMTEIVLGPAWPFACEFVCYAIVQVLLLFERLMGEATGVALTVSALAVCVHKRVEAGSDWPRSSKQWQHAHAAVAANRLPLCLMVLLLTKLLRRARLTRTGRDAHGWQKVLHSQSFISRVAAVLGPAMAIVGFLATGFAEWCWVHGPRSLLPVYSYPCLINLPLVLGLVPFLEAGSHQPASAGSWHVPLLRAVEPWCLPALQVHHPINMALRGREGLRWPKTLLTSWFLVGHAPLLFGWTLAASWLVACVRRPFERGAAVVMQTVSHGPCHCAGRWAATALLTGAACAIVVAEWAIL